MNRKIIRRTIWGGFALVGAIAVTAVLGSRPDNPAKNGPLRSCPDTPNCYANSVRMPGSLDKVREAVMQAVTSHGSLLSGRPTSIQKTEQGLTAVFQVGPFRDDVEIAVASADGESVVHLRSAARVGRSDLGINRARGQAILAEIRDRL